MNAMRCNSGVFRIGMLCGALGLAFGSATVSAQQMDPNMKMPMSMPMPPAAKAAVKKPAAKSPAKKKVAPEKKKKTVNAKPDAHPAMPMPADEATMPGMDHGNMAMPTPENGQPKDHSGMSMPAGHEESMQGMQGMEGMEGMEGMDHSTMGHDAMTMPVTEPREPIPQLTDADRAAAVSPASGHAAHDNSIQHYVLFDRLEAWNADKGTGLEWEGKAWIGTDLNRVWLRSEGERVDNSTEAADLEVLYGHSIATWWDVVVGGRHDFKPGTSRDFAAIGVMGVVPSKYDVEATAYIGQSGQTSARLQAEYDTLLTGRLILQSLVEVNLYGQDDRRRGIGSGLSTLETGYRLRYEFTRRFAPYIGIVQERAFGKTAGFRREEGNPTKDTRFVAGIRIWF